jgi:hypothetical protein
MIVSDINLISFRYLSSLTIIKPAIICLNYSIILIDACFHPSIAFFCAVITAPFFYFHRANLPAVSLTIYPTIFTASRTRVSSSSRFFRARICYSFIFRSSRFNTSLSSATESLHSRLWITRPSPFSGAATGVSSLFFIVGSYIKPAGCENGASNIPEISGAIL